MKKSFYDLHLFGEFNDRGKPVLLVCNHISWWDGIWALWFNQKVLKKKYHFMMLEEQLRKNWFFQYTGGFSVRKKSKSVIETINYTSELLTEKENVVLLFPTGKIQSMHKHEFAFEKGVEKILKKLESEIHIIFLVNLTDYFSNPKPSLYSFFEDYTGEHSINAIRNEFNRFYQDCIEHQKQKEE